MLRGELAAAEMERFDASQQVRLLWRARVPNVTFSAFAQSDGFGMSWCSVEDSVMVSPLPAPLGPSRRGEIREAQARVAQSEAELERVVVASSKRSGKPLLHTARRWRHRRSHPSGRRRHGWICGRWRSGGGSLASAARGAILATHPHRVTEAQSERAARAAAVAG